MGLGTDRYNGGAVSRERQDAFAALSHERAANAIKEGRLADEIVPVSIAAAPRRAARRRARRGRASRHHRREPRRAAAGVRRGRHVTAGNASQLSDGASAVIVMSPAAAERRGVTPLGEYVAYGMVAGPDSASLLHQPSAAINAALAKAGLGVGDVDLFEINEAFAAVGIASMEDLGITDEVTNVNGGAIALGHPIGMSGNRLALTALHELRRRGGGTGGGRPLRRRRPGRRADPALRRVAKRHLGARSRIPQLSAPRSRSENSRARLPFASL